MYYELSDAANWLQGQPMFKILSRVKEMERLGEHIVHFEIGDPDFDTPENIVEAGVEALRRGFTHYSDSMGDFDFRVALAKYNAQSRGFCPDIAQVLVAPGANILIYFAVRCLVNPGDEVIVQNPCFPSYHAVFNFCGVKAVSVPLLEENAYRLNPKDLEKKITDKTRLIIINSPHNPTGAVMRQDELEEIALIAKKHKIYLYLDEIYSRMNYGETPFYSPSIIDKCRDYIILATGFSKIFAMTGWRLGIGIGPVKVMQKMGLLMQTTVSCVPSFIQKAGIEAILGEQDKVREMIDTYKRRRDLLVQGLNSIDKITCLKPGGAFYVFPNIKQTGLSSNRFTELLLERSRVAVCSGSDFGSQGEGYIRLCYAASEADIEEGVNRIRRFVSDL